MTVEAGHFTAINAFSPSIPVTVYATTGELATLYADPNQRHRRRQPGPYRHIRQPEPLRRGCRL